SFSFSRDGAIFGGHVGANYQINHILLGVELTGAVAGLNERRVGPLVGVPPDPFKNDSSDLFTLPGRPGYVYDKFLFYGKAGYANGGVDVSAITTSGITASANARESGWVIGTGVEMRLLSEVVFGIEYNFIDFPGDRFTSVTGGTVANLP